MSQSEEIQATDPAASTLCSAAIGISAQEPTMTHEEAQAPQSATNPADEIAAFPAPWNYLIPAGKRLVIWILFLTTLYLLRDFLGLVFLTFVFAYVAEHGVQGLAHRFRSRKLRTLLVFGTILSVLALLATFLGPELKRQALTFVREVPTHLHSIDNRIDSVRKDYPWFDDFVGDRKAKDLLGEFIGLHPSETVHAAESGSAAGAGSAASAATPARKPAPHGMGADSKQIQSLFGTLLGIFKNLAAVGMIFVLAVLFAFLIVMDLPRIAKGIASLRDTRLNVVYREISDTIVTFGRVLGRFIEAQGMIALINTALTAIGMLILGMNSLAFLAAVVFLCSFIPVAGVYLSTLPMCLVALDQSGFGLVLWVLLMVTIVHVLEAYVFNPMIFGAHLHMNPVLVLAVLVIGYQLFGVWGLILGVPAVNYIFGYAIRRPVEPAAEQA
jgi:predicted PurR-regulated permease PerM